jgi:hypothetical protein
MSEVKKYEEAAQTGIPEDASITNPWQPLLRLRGSHSSQHTIRALPHLLPPRDGEGGDGGEEPPPLPVSTPDLAFQISPCLPAELNDVIVSAVRQALDPNADVRTACFTQTQRVGVWLRPSVNEQDNQARNQALKRLKIIGAGETLAFFLRTYL